MQITQSSGDSQNKDKEGAHQQNMDHQKSLDPIVVGILAVDVACPSNHVTLCVDLRKDNMCYERRLLQ
jgi:hypothetical protein